MAFGLQFADPALGAGCVGILTVGRRELGDCPGSLVLLSQRHFHPLLLLLTYFSLKM